MRRVAITVNGVRHESEVEPRQLLVYFLREQLGLTGTNVGCDTSSCGACTILLDGESVKSCTVLAVQADGAEITTIEGLASNGELHPVQRAIDRLQLRPYLLAMTHTTPAITSCSLASRNFILVWRTRSTSARNFDLPFKRESTTDSEALTDNGESRRACARTGAPANPRTAFKPIARKSELLPDIFDPLTT